MEWTPGRHTTNTDLRRTAGVGLEGKEATSFISLKSKSILNKSSISGGKRMYNFKESLIK